MTPAKTQIANLIKLAHADGKLDPHEQKLIFGIVANSNLSHYEFEDIIAHASEWSTVPPEDENGRIVYFYQLLILATVDREVSDVESKFLQHIGTQLGLRADNVAEAIRHIEQNTETDLSELEIRSILSGGVN